MSSLFSAGYITLVPELAVQLLLPKYFLDWEVCVTIWCLLLPVLAPGTSENKRVKYGKGSPRDSVLGLVCCLGFF